MLRARSLAGDNWIDYWIDYWNRTIQKTDYWDLVPGLQAPHFVSADTCMEVMKQVYKKQQMSSCVFPLIMKWVIKKYMYNFPLVEMEAYVLWPEA
jgi:hypothetical protein